MKSIAQGKDRVKKICDVLRRETLEPAKEEAKTIIEKGKVEAKRLIDEAKKEANRLRTEGAKEMEEKKALFEASIRVACKKSIDSLKQEIEKKIFHPQLHEILGPVLSEPKWIGELLTAIVHALEKEGIHAHLQGIIPKHVSVAQVNQYLSEKILQKLSKESIALENFAGGAKLRVKEKKLTIDISEDAVRHLLAEYIQEDFRSTIFHAQG